MFCGGIFDPDHSLRRLDELNSLSEEPGLWDNPANAQKILKERTKLQQSLDGYFTLQNQLTDLVALLELAKQENDILVLSETTDSLVKLQGLAQKRKLESLLSGEADSNDCYVEVHGGAGGTEAQDWAELVLRMYLRWAEQHGYKTETLDESPGEEAGLKSATVRISGFRAYGWLKYESGVHRLVRISPFDSQSRRHTSFCSVWVYPVVDDTIDIEILDKDLRVDTFRSSGAGGQHVNKTDSAIRITHLPTNIVVQCQSDRSQHRNRATAMDMLRARLYELELQKREEKAAAEQAQKTQIGWGHQIRSYVLHPYQMIKDLRTQEETTDTMGVLNGDIDRFLYASLAQRLGDQKK